LQRQAALLVVHLSTLIGCANPIEPSAARLDQPFTLSPGAAAVVEGENLQVGFDQVLSDSRCPVGAQCIVAGEATVRVWLVKAPRGRENVELKTTTAASQATYDAYRISLVTVTPSPEVGQTIRPSDYAVTLLLTRSP
jgi:hypothetical protein